MGAVEAPTVYRWHGRIRKGEALEKNEMRDEENESAFDRGEVTSASGRACGEVLPEGDEDEHDGDEGAGAETWAERMVQWNSLC